MNFVAACFTDVGRGAASRPVRSTCQLAAKKLPLYCPASQSGATDGPSPTHFAQNAWHHTVRSPLITDFGRSKWHKPSPIANKID